MNRTRKENFETNPNPRRSKHMPGCSDQSDDVLRLTWAILDGEATVAEQRQLQRLVHKQYSSRVQYLEAVQLEIDIQEVLQSENTPVGPADDRLDRLADPHFRENPQPVVTSPFSTNPMRAAS